jgi:hypothetical protein
MARPDMHELVELTPDAVAEIRHWLLVLAADPSAPAWDPAEDYQAPHALHAAAQWLTDNGHAGGLEVFLVAVLLAMFSIGVRLELDTAGDALGADCGLLVDLERLARECSLETWPSVADAPGDGDE